MKTTDHIIVASHVNIRWTSAVVESFALWDIMSFSRSLRLAMAVQVRLKHSSTEVD